MLALQALCALEAVGDEFLARLDEFLCDDEVLADLEVPEPPDGEVTEFARQLATGAWAQRRRLDRKLAETSAHWSVDRMTPVDRNVLRMGLYELLEIPENPPQVVINEAIELARRFGDMDSPAFVNGVLDATRRACAAGGRAKDQAPPANGSEEPRGENGTDGGNESV
jgi:N utilization substance protein B